jgi:membrane associated rhomboid family serine protease
MKRHRKTSYRNLAERIGARTLTGMAIALLSAVLLFASPEIGLAGAIGGVVFGGISAMLMRPHS